MQYPACRCGRDLSYGIDLFFLFFVPSLLTSNRLHISLAIAEHQSDVFIELFIIYTKSCWMAMVNSEIIILYVKFSYL